MRDALDRMGVTDRERELEDKHYAGTITDDEWAEFDQLRSGREARNRAKQDAERDAERARRIAGKVALMPFKPDPANDPNEAYAVNRGAHL